MASAEPVLKVCQSCQQCKSKMDKCSICKQKFRLNVYYCSKECQTKDWKTHKQLHKDKEKEQANPISANSKPVPVDENAEPRDENGMTQLMKMAYEGNWKEVKRKLEEGSDPILVDKQGLSALNYAIAQRQTKVVEILAQYSSMELLLQGPAQWKKSSCLFQAVHVGCIDIVKILLKAGGDELVHQTDRDGRTCLHVACKTGQRAIVECLLNLGGDALLEKIDLDGMPCLQAACQENHIDIVRALLRHGDGSFLRKPCFGGYYCMNSAILNGHTEIVKLLLKAGGADLLKQIPSGAASHLYVAASHGRTELVKLLHKAGGDDALFHHAPDGCSCLHAASCSGWTEVVRYLIKVGGERLLFVPGPNGATCLYGACGNGQAETALLLIKAGGRALATQCDDQGVPPFCLACQSGSVELVRALLEYTSKDQIATASPRGSPLHVASALGHLSVVRALTEHGGEALPATQNRAGLNCMHTACLAGKLEVVKYLLSLPNGLELARARSANKLNPLFCAAAEGKIEIVRELLRFVTRACGGPAGGGAVAVREMLDAAISTGGEVTAAEHALHNGHYETASLLQALAEAPDIACLPSPTAAGEIILSSMDPDTGELTSHTVIKPRSAAD